MVITFSLQCFVLIYETEMNVLLLYATGEFNHVIDVY